MAAVSDPRPRAQRRADHEAPLPEPPLTWLLGDWVVDGAVRQLRRKGTAVALEPRQMAVLTALSERPGQVLTTDALLSTCWHGEATGDNPLHKVVTALRRALGDDAAAPRYIETIRGRGYRLVAPVRSLSHHGERSLVGAWRGRSPFRGLQAFGAAEASVFFGRDAEVTLLRDRLAALWQQGEAVAVLLGPSGCGKTSLVQAGLLPALATASAGGTGDALRVCASAVVDLGANELLGPWQALAGGLLDWEVDGVPLLSGHSIDSLATALQHEPHEVLRTLDAGLAAHAPVPGLAPPLLVLDRFEALLQPAAARERAEVMAWLALVAERRAALVLMVCRNDFYPELARLPLLMQGKRHGGHVDLMPPTAGAIAQMIRLPARAAGLHFGTDASGMNRLDDRLCAEAAHGQDALPLLQYTLQALYEARSPGDALTWDAYEDLGGLEGAIGRRAEAVLAARPPSEQDALPALLARLVGLAGEDAQPTGRWAERAAIHHPDERRLVDALIDERLLVSDRVGGVASVRVAHEALLRCWPRVTGWITQHRAMLAVRDELTPWVDRWLEGQRAPGLLLPRGTLLWRAAGALTEAGHLFGAREHDYVSRSLKRLRRQTQWRWAGAVAMGLLALVAVVAALRSAQLERVALERQQQSQRLTSFMLGDLADQLRPIGRLDLLDRVGQQGIDVLGSGGGATEPPEDTLQRVRALIVLGEVNSTRGRNRVGTALDALQRADTLLDDLERRPGRLLPAALHKARGTAAFWRGQIAFDGGDLETAMREMAQYRAACERWLALAPDDAEATAELSYAVGSLGAIAIRRGAWAEARRWYETSLRMKLDALPRDPADPARVDAVATARGWLGQIAHARGELHEALALYDEARLARERLRDRHPSQKAYLHDLAVLHMRRAETLHSMGREAEARAAADAALDHYGEAVRHDPDNTRWHLDLLHAESARLVLRVDTSERPASEPLGAVRADLARRVPPSLRDDFVYHLMDLQLLLAEATDASRRRAWSEVDALGARSEAVLATLTQHRPHDRLVSELQARLALLRIQRWTQAAAPSVREAACARVALELDPIVGAGQGGWVLNAWLAARRCAGQQSDADGAQLGRLTTGGHAVRLPHLVIR